MSIFGTRPEAIKMAPLVKALEKQEGIESVVCVTAQHRDMLDQVMHIFDIQADYDLDIMKPRQTLAQITNNALIGLDEVIKEAKPQMILVHGDTTTTFVGSLAAFYNQIKVGHVEAGLRTGNKNSPYPEEMNRKLTGSIADIHFAPTNSAAENLLREAIDENTIYITGNTVIDAIKTTVQTGFSFRTKELNAIDFNKKIILVTAHRRENLGEPLENICRALLHIIKNNEDVEIIYAVHKNPAVRDVVNQYLGDVKGVHLLEPLEVDEMHNLISQCYLVLTDSGGLQEEAPSLGKPVLVLRNETERPEAVAFGTVKLVGLEEKNIREQTQKLLSDEAEYTKMATATNPYGDGKASQRIVQAILHYFDETKERPSTFTP